MIPTCCGKRATPYRKEWSLHAGRTSWEEGYRCKKCGSIRLPYFDSFDTAYMESLEAVRQAGIDYDRVVFGLIYDRSISD